MVAGVFNYLCDNAMAAYGDGSAQDEARAIGVIPRKQPARPA
jgi:hypothetical protein